MESDQMKRLLEPIVPPGPAEQREIIINLEKEPEANHAYFVSTNWYRSWKSFVGLSKAKETARENRKAFRVSKDERGISAEQEMDRSGDRKSCTNKDGANAASASREKRRRKQKSNSQELSGELPDLEKAEKSQNEGNRNSKTGACLNGSGNYQLTSSSSTNPGPVTMDTQENEHNILIDEKIWSKWVEWFGLATSHQLDRRNWSSQEKYFEVCLLSPYSSIVENPLKVLDMTETVGYIEVQLRKMYRVPLHKKTRLWISEKVRHARFKLALERNIQLLKVHNISFNLERDYIIALEVSTAQGTWPTCVSGDPDSDLVDLLALTKGLLPQDYWVQELTQTVDSVFGGISCEMKETAEGIIQTAKCVTSMKEMDLLKIKDNLDEKNHIRQAKELPLQEKGAKELEKYLDDKSAELVLEERNLKQAVSVVKQEREFLDDEKQKLQSEIQEMDKLNKITENKVTLDVGGHVYSTSILTLTKDPQSMLAVMFSGRHSLVREADGSFFLDRDGTHFRYILNFLRDGGFRDGTLPQDRGSLMELLTEAEYYQISGLVKCLREHLDSASVSTSRSFAEEKHGSSGDDEDSGTPKKPLRRVVYRREITTAT